MSRAQLVEQARRTLSHARAGTQPLEDGMVTVPATDYLDPGRWRLEVDRVFRRLPLVLAASCELAEPRSYLALDVVGTPVLLVRGTDGVLRSFLNSCSHRGAAVAEPGSGSARRFACPYHGWTYDTEGALVGMFDKAAFGSLDRSCRGLTPLPVAERAGLVFGGVVPGGTLDVDTFLCGYDTLLELHALAGCRLLGRQTLDGPAWKIAYDGYLDFYHLPILHRRTFGPDYDHRICGDAWGPHQRQMQPDGRIAALGGLAEDDWPLETLLAGVWTVFPHVSLASFRVGGHKLYQLSQLFPGATPGSSVTVLSYLGDSAPDDDERAAIDKQMDFLREVVANEDYHTGFGIQRAIATGLKHEVLFGRNEGSNQRFHLWLDHLVAAETLDDTAALFAAATEAHHPAAAG